MVLEQPFCKFSSMDPNFSDKMFPKSPFYSRPVTFLVKVECKIHRQVLFYVLVGFGPKIVCKIANYEKMCQRIWGPYWNSYKMVALNALKNIILYEKLTHASKMNNFAHCVNFG